MFDLLEIDENSVRIIDYKTGQGLKSLTSTSQADGIRAWKHRLQLTYYTLLARYSGIANQNQTVSAEMVYVEADDPAHMRKVFTPGPEELERLAKIIQVVCARLHTVDLPDVSSYDKDLSGILQFESDLLKSYNKE